MTKKKVLDVLAIIFFLWLVISVAEIGFRNPLAESHEYSPLNLIQIVCGLFGM